MASIDDFPNEILIQIFSYVNIVERQRFEIVCKKWRSIIQRMWSTIRKLKFSCYNKKAMNKEYISDGLHLVSDNLLHLRNVLKLFNGNLTKLEIEYLILNKSPRINEVPNKVLSLLHGNKDLRTIRIQCDDSKVAEEFLESLVADNLQHISIDLLCKCTPRIVQLTYKILRNARTLKFLQIDINSTVSLGIISTINSLESLHMDMNPIGNIFNLTNLEMLSWGDADITDEWLIELAKHCKKLRGLEIFYDESYGEVGLNAISSMPNLRHLILRSGPPINNEVLNNLSNLETIYCELDDEITPDELSNFLQRSPNLKKYDFGNEYLNELFGEIIDAAGAKTEVFGMEAEERILFDYDWAQIL